MPTDNEKKRAIARALVEHPDHYSKDGRILSSNLYKFGTHGNLSFNFAASRGSRPGIGFYFTAPERETYEEQFSRILLPAGYSLNTDQPHHGDGTRGWICFCKSGVERLKQAYEDIVSPGEGLEDWKNLLKTLRSEIGAIVKVSATEDQEESGWPPGRKVRVDPTTLSISAPSHDNELRHPRNRLVFGAPGTGKSYSLKAAYEGDNASFHGRWERVTFYPTYSYAQFVGTYKPIMKPDTRNPDEEKIAYQFVPGPFLRMLVKAANDPDNNYLLIVEEINRANAAAVFGDVFQLLDRTDEGESEYSIGASEDIVRYLEKNGKLNGEAKDYFKLQDGSAELKLPKNLYIWATMNSADQGVFPLDTAFKRRWEFEYIGINAEENVGGCSEWTLEDNNYNSNYKWNEVRKFINDLLSAYGVNEDKMMGPFFVKARQDDGGNYLPIPQGQFESKVLMYLWEDAARMFRRQMFGDVKTYSQLLEKWEKSGMQIFGQDSKLGAEGALRDRYNAFPKPSVQPNHPNGDPQPPDADQP